MSFLFDLLGFVLLGAFFVLFWKRPFSDSLLSLTVILLSLSVAALAFTPLSQKWLQPKLTASVERSAANELADLFSAPHLPNGRDTVADLSFDEIIEQRPTAYQTILERYAADADKVEQQYRADPQPSTLLSAVCTPRIRFLSNILSFSALWAVGFVIFWLIAKKVAHNLRPSAPLRGLRHLPSALVGFLYGALILCGVQIVLQWLIVLLSGRTLLFGGATLQSSLLHTVLCRINPLWWLLFG